MKKSAFKVGDKVLRVPDSDRIPPYVVTIMAIASGYAMVRRPRAVPFAVSVKELKPIEEEKNGE